MDISPKLVSFQKGVPVIELVVGKNEAKSSASDVGNVVKQIKFSKKKTKDDEKKATEKRKLEEGNFSSECRIEIC